MASLAGTMGMLYMSSLATCQTTNTVVIPVITQHKKTGVLHPRWSHVVCIVIESAKCIDKEGGCDQCLGLGCGITRGFLDLWGWLVHRLEVWRGIWLKLNWKIWWDIKD